uniref:Putative alpha/beta hydrolase fold protein n=1 Tax=Periglandula ipomoeae TaxID=1037530 RepID=G9FM53_9HYPO|nr:putative alpha/beta hydrolase fold protein [Periglandula ipomoeae]
MDNIVLQTSEIFDDFTIIDQPFWTRENHPILAHIILPRSYLSSSSKPSPVIINWHGGYLVAGHGLLPLFFPPLLLSLAKKHSAIIISPDHALLPRKEGLSSVQADAEAFHHWLHSSFADTLAEKAPSYEPDLTRILLHGGSSGAYLALSSALSHPKSYRCLSLMYPMIDFDTDWWRKGSRAVGAPNPGCLPDAAFPVDDQVVMDQLEKFREGPIVTIPGAERDGFGACVARAGLFPEIFNPGGKLDDDSAVWLNRRVEQGSELPERIWVLHADGDTVVPVETSLSFAQTMKQQDRPVRLDIVKGLDHCCDMAVTEDWKGSDDPVVFGAAEWLVEKWLE